MGTLNMNNTTQSKSSIKGFRIRWNKESGLTENQKEHLRKNLLAMSEKIFQSMECAKEEAARNEVAELRLPLPPHTHLHSFLTIEYSNNGWHMILETLDECIGEIVCPDAECIQMLKKSDVEEETL